MYEMQGTSPGLAASGQPVAWPSRRERAARQSQEPALGSGCPAPPTSRSCPRAVPVSNGESISTASARYRARPVRIFFRPFFASTGYPQNMAGYPHSIAVFHCLLHRSSTGYQASPGGTVSRLYLIECYFHGISEFDLPYPRERRGDYQVKFGRPFRRIGRRDEGHPGASRCATMRTINRGRHHWRRRVRPGEGR